MRVFIIGMAAAAMCYFTVGCAASISPVPGVEVGFDADLDRVGGTVAIDPISAGCETAKAVSWNWLENQLCKEEVPAAE